jgi:Na+/H+-translocating membrane pyrophosphatase
MIAFILGASTSLLSGYIGMSVATASNARVTFNAAKYNDDDLCYRKAFNVAYRGGMVMGFCLVSLALFVLLAIIYVYQSNKIIINLLYYLNYFLLFFILLIY